MSKANDCWGIEVGANAIKGVRLVAEAGEARLVEYDVIPFNKVLSTPDLNVDEAIQVNLDQFLSRHELRGASVLASVPGHMAFARFAKLPPVEPKKIPDIVRFEAVQQIPFPIDQVEWDYQVFAQEDSPDVEVGIFAITKDRAAQFLSNFRTIGLSLDGITLSPLAVYNAMAYDLELDEESEGLILMDIGTTSTDVIIVEQGRIWLRTLPIGGNNFTEALVRSFKLSFSKAEKLKREAGTSKYARQIFQAMRPVFADLVQEVQRSLGFYQSLNREAKLERLIGLGSTFRLPGLQKFLQQQLQIDVQRPTARDQKQPGFRRITAEGSQAAEFSEHAMNLATAYGLALQGLGLGRVNANILPAHIVKQRMWRAKQPWIAAAAAVVVAGAALPCITLWKKQNDHKGPYEANLAKFQEVQTKAIEYKKAWVAIEAQDPRKAIENYLSVLLYRNVWPSIMADVGEAIRSLNAPANLYQDPDQVAKTPRGQRNRIYITSYKVKYEPAAVTAGAEIGDKATGRFVVTLEGYTPLQDSAGSGLINTDFVNALNNVGKQGERAYKLATETKAVTSLHQRGSETGAGGGAAPPPPVSDLWPHRPLQNEPGREKDQLFTMQFVVELLAPNEVRKSLAAPASPASQPATQPASAPVAAAVAPALLPSEDLR